MRVPSLQAALRWGRASEGVWRTLLNWAFESRLPRTWTLCFVCICWSSKPPPPSTASQPLSRAPLENRQNMFLMKAEPLAARGAILVHTFCLPPFSLSHTHTHTHTHTHSQNAWQAWGLSIMHVQHCIQPQARRGDGEKGLVLLLGLAEVASAIGTMGGDSLHANGCEFAQIAEYHVLGNKQHSPRCFWLSCVPYKSICWDPNHQYLRMWPCLEIASSQL